VATRGRAGAECASGRVERAPLSHKLITRALLVRNADFEFIVRPHLAARLLPADLLDIQHRRPVRNRNRQMATDDEGRYHDHQPPRSKPVPIGEMKGIARFPVSFHIQIVHNLGGSSVRFPTDHEGSFSR
jgi:hypothetical protein